MKRILFLFVFFITACEPDEPPPFHCDMQYYPLPQSRLSFVEFKVNQDSVYFRNISSNNIISFGKLSEITSHIIDTTQAGDCYNYDYISSAYYSNNSPIYRFWYLLQATFVEQNDFQIKIGDPDSFCATVFKITTETDTVDLDSIQIADKIFYDVYLRTASGCSSGMYYNKQYGMVGFNWLGEWYVLETDSL